MLAKHDPINARPQNLGRSYYLHPNSLISGADGQALSHHLEAPSILQVKLSWYLLFSVLFRPCCALSLLREVLLFHPSRSFIALVALVVLFILAHKIHNLRDILRKP